MSLINDRDKVKQVIDFTGAQNGKMHPMDIDAVLEFDNRILILIEVKYKGNDIPTGQRLTLERICNSWYKKDIQKTREQERSKAIVLKVEHYFRDSTKNIPIENCVVTQIYYNEKWSKIYDVNLIDYLNKLGKEWKCEKCKF
tara:strand:+ start:35 stop:460 length:426 start_codon:yes stop_codon:yes gene_type:complete